MTEKKAQETDRKESALEPVEEAVAAPYDPWTDLVAVQLFKDDGLYKDDVFVCVNGREFYVRRGEIQQVPRCVKEVLDHSAMADEQARKVRERETGYHQYADMA